MQTTKQDKKQLQSNTPSSRRNAISTIGAVGAVSALGVWSKPIVNHIVLPAHAAMSDEIPTDVFTAGSYAFEFPNGGVQNTTDCDAGSVNAGNNLTAGIVDFSASISSTGSFTAGILAALTGSDTIDNVIGVDGSINFNDTFSFNDSVLGACETEVTIMGTAAGSSISGTVAAEVRCEGCVSSFTTPFTASIES